LVFGVAFNVFYHAVVRGWLEFFVISGSSQIRPSDLCVRAVPWRLRFASRQGTSLRERLRPLGRGSSEQARADALASKTMLRISCRDAPKRPRQRAIRIVTIKLRVRL